jgi:hypothetical protein
MERDKLELGGGGRDSARGKHAATRLSQRDDGASGSGGAGGSRANPDEVRRKTCHAQAAALVRASRRTPRRKPALATDASGATWG